MEVRPRTRGGYGAAPVAAARDLGLRKPSPNEKRVPFPVRPRHVEFGECLPGGCGLLPPLVDIRDDRAPVLSFAFPLNATGVDPYRLISLRYCGQYSHERSGTDKWHQERCSVTAVRQEILEQVHAGRNLRTTLIGCVDLHPV